MRSDGNREHAPTGRLNLSPERSQERRMILSCPYNVWHQPRRSQWHRAVGCMPC